LFSQDLTPVNVTTIYGAALNYTIDTWSGSDGLYPSEIRGFTLKINLAESFVGSSIGIYYQFQLIDLDTSEIIIITNRETLDFNN
jgi:hypothetical protein